MPPKPVDNVTKLLQAEEKRNRMVADGKAKKAARVKQAKADAEKDVATFRKEKEAELERFTADLNSGAQSTNLKTEQEIDGQIRALHSVAATRLELVAETMVALVCTVPK